MNAKFTYLVLFILLPACVRAQNAASIVQDTAAKKDMARQTDLIHIAKGLFHIRPHSIRQERNKKLIFPYFRPAVPCRAVPAGRW